MIKKMIKKMNILNKDDLYMKNNLNYGFHV